MALPTDSEASTREALAPLSLSNYGDNCIEPSLHRPSPVQQHGHDMEGENPSILAEQGDAEKEFSRTSNSRGGEHYGHLRDGDTHPAKGKALAEMETNDQQILTERGSVTSPYSPPTTSLVRTKRSD